MTYISTKLKKEISISSIVTIHYFEYMKDFIFNGESHDFWEFLYVDKGCVSVSADDTYFQLNAGDIIFHKPEEFHSIESKGKTAPNLVAISFLSDSPAIHFFEQKYFTLSIEERTLISLIISEARQAFSTPLHLPSVEQVVLNEDALFGAQQMTSLYLEQFLIAVKRNHSKNDASLIVPTPSLPHMELPAGSQRLASIINFMERHIFEQLTVGEICEEFSLSRSTLHSLFHKEKQCGAMDFFNNMKINRAKDIIRDGSKNLTEIAHYLSYSSLQHFSRQFKKTIGMSPHEYASSVKGLSQAIGQIPKREKKPKIS